MDLLYENFKVVSDPVIYLFGAMKQRKRGSNLSGLFPVGGSVAVPWLNELSSSFGFLRWQLSDLGINSRSTYSARRQIVKVAQGC